MESNTSVKMFGNGISEITLDISGKIILVAKFDKILLNVIFIQRIIERKI